MTDCPDCKESNEYQIATVSNQLNSVHKIEEEAAWTIEDVLLDSARTTLVKRLTKAMGAIPPASKIHRVQLLPRFSGSLHKPDLLAGGFQIGIHRVTIPLVRRGE